MDSNSFKKLKRVLSITNDLSSNAYLERICLNISDQFGFQNVIIATPLKKSKNKFRTLVATSKGHLIDNFFYEIEGTPCSNVYNQMHTILFKQDVQKLFPIDQMLIDMNIVSYVGSPLVDRTGNFVGILIICDSKPLEDGVENLTEIIASRVGLELGRELELFSFNSYHTNIENFLLMSDTDLNGKIIKVNKKFCEVSGYSEEELIGQDHRVLNSGHHPKSFFEKMWQTIKSGNFWEGEVLNRAKDGSLYWVNSFMFPFYEQGEIKGYSSVRFEITDRKQAELELSAEKEKLAFTSQLAAIGEISAGIGHEIANPLAVIFASSDILIKKLDSTEPTISRSLERIKLSCERISKIVKGLHHLSQGARNDDYKNESINEIVNYTLDFCEEALKAKHIELRCDRLDHEAFLFCNSVKISQVLLNLVNNARDAIDMANSNERWIHVNIADNENDIVFTVNDSGPGIPIDQRKKVMQSFFTTKEVGKGTGLGLPLINRFVKEHKGTFEITDTEKTSFVVTLPKAA